MDNSVKSEEQHYLFTSNSQHQYEGLEDTVPKNKITSEQNRTYNYDTGKSVNIGSSVPPKTMSEAAISRPKLAIMRNFILREGKDEDVAREPKVLTSFQKRSQIESQFKYKADNYKTEKSVSSHKNIPSIERTSPPPKKSSRNSVSPKKTPEKGLEKQSFYRYFTQEIVRITNRNTQLQKKLQQTSNSLQYQQKMNIQLKQENSRIKEQLEQVKYVSRERQSEIDHLRARLADQERFQLEKVKQQLYKIGENRRIEEVQISKYMKMVTEKDEKNNALIEQIRNLKLQNLKLMGLADQNIRLNRKISQLINRNHQLQRKVVGKSETVDHLWSVKEIEYCNILGLIKMAGDELS